MKGHFVQYFPVGVLFVAALSFSGPTGAQSSGGAWGGELQLYPAGVIPGVHLDFARSERELLTFRAGYNITERDDFGEHDDEDGGGPGLGAGYRRYFEEELHGWSLGARLDLWRVEIDWVDDPGRPSERSGTTEMFVVQPTIEGGYGFDLGDSPWRLDATLAFGVEINVDVDGEDVGEGAILLGGLTFVRRW